MWIGKGPLINELMRIAAGTIKEVIKRKKEWREKLKMVMKERK